MASHRKTHRTKPDNEKKSRELLELDAALSEGRFQHVIDALSNRMRTGKRSPISLYQLGMAWLGLKDVSQATKYFEESIAAGGNPTAAQQQLARAYFLLGRFSDAAKTLRLLIQSNAGYIEYWRNLVLALESHADVESALVVCHEAIDRFPKDASLFRQLGDLHYAKENWTEATNAYRQCVERDASREDARKRYVALLRRVGDRQSVCEALDQWLQFAPNHPIAEHLRGAYIEGSPPTRASDDYVRELFDQFADTFDAKLTELGYQAPQSLAEHLMRLKLPHTRSLQVLDAGCGTGLLGEWLLPYAATLYVVDLSGQMLVQAEKRSLYDELTEAELTAYLVARTNAFDLVASADTLNYFGDLRPFCAAARSALRSVGGWLAFTLESHSSSDGLSSKTEESEYVLQPSGRYTHATDRVVEILRTSGFIEIELTACVLRQEAGRDVCGVVISCRTEPAVSDQR